MRISDWSSDVCSSDLIETEHAQARRGVAAAADPQLAVRVDGERAQILVGETIDDHRCSVAAGIEAIQAVAGGGIAGTADEVSAIITDHHHVHDGSVRMRFVVDKIRRAWCRESVCTIVYISVGPVSLKKKK